MTSSLDSASPEPRNNDKSRKRSRKMPAAENPLLARWTKPFGLPPFEDIKPRHFRPAFDAAFRAHRAEIEAIAENPRRPTFRNTIVAMEKCGVLLRRVGAVFSNLDAAHTNPELQDLAREVIPRFASHETQIMLDPRLFKRVEDLYRRRDQLKLSAEDRRVLERHHLGFVRAGARLTSAQKARVKAINARLAALFTQFMQNVLKDEQTWQMVLDPKTDLDGLPPSLRASACQAAKDAGLRDKAVITLARSSVEGFLTFSSRRDLREQAFEAWIARGALAGDTDNRQIITEAAALRQEFAKLLGVETFAEFSLQDTMAKTPEAVNELLLEIWPRAVKRVVQEREELVQQARASGDNAKLAPCDWRYYAEKVRRAKYDIDDAEIRPYLTLENMIAAAFYCAGKLFGLVFEERFDLPKYHPDCRTWEVKDSNGKHVGVFIGDYFARSSKRSGAWMSSFRDQHKIGKGEKPIVVNVMNFGKGEAGQRTLLSFDDARTLFHEFGHALHGLLSDVTYPSISGTSVSRDFVELPSQLYEHWLSTPDVLSKFACHFETGEPISEDIIRRLSDAKNFNQGFATVEYLSSALADMALYSAPITDLGDIEAFERKTLKRIGMPDEIVMRHRLPHFMHIIAGYAAGYYSYLWSEVMDADAFMAFEESGDVFDKETAHKLKTFVYQAGNSRDPEEAYVAFRGRAPNIDALLKKRGLDE